MKGLIAWWVKNPVAANLLMLGVIISGWLGLVSMEKEAFPQIDSNVVQVEVAWPGASPQEVEQQLIQRVEESLKNVPNVYRVRSESRENFGYVTVETYPKVDINGFLNDVKNAVDSITSFPRDIENPRVRFQDWRNEMMRVALVGDIGEKALTRLANELRNEVAALPYISQVELYGARREEVTIEVSEAALRRYNLSFDDVARAIRANSLNISSGEVRSRTGDIQLRANNLADTALDFERIVVRQTERGAVIHLSDVARVIDGFEENEILATLNGAPAVLIQIKSTDNMQVVKATEVVRDWIAQRKATLPETVDLVLWFSTAEIYESRMDLITNSSLMGLGLVFLVLIFSLRPSVAFWVTSGIGVSFLGAFALLPANDVSLNIISTFAFLLVLGIVVDDAIVVGESIHLQVQEGSASGPEAAVEGTLSVSRPVIFAVLTTIVAFAPWLFLSGAEAQVTRQLSIVISLALVFSLAEAFLILPSHLSHLKPREHLEGWKLKLQNVSDRITWFAEVHYRPLLERCLRRRYTTVLVFLSAFVISVTLFATGWVKFFFMPQVENEQIVISVTMPPGTPYSRALEVLDQLQEAERLLSDEIEGQAEEAGGSGHLIEGWYTRSQRDSVVAIVRLAPPEKRDLSAKQASQRLAALVGDIPDADQVEVNFTISESPPTVTFVLQHPDLNLLKSASEKLQTHLKTYDKALYVRDSQQGELPELKIRMKPGAEKLGVTLSEVSRQVRQGYFGEEVQRLPRDYGDVRVMVRYPISTREQLASLDDFMVRTLDGRELPLFAIADVELDHSVQKITRRNGRRIVQVVATVDPDALSDINRSVTENYIPELQKQFPELNILKGGSQEAEADFFRELASLYTVALFIIYALIAVAFRSYFLPLLIMTAIPFGFMGAIYGHLLFDLPLALFSYFGIGAAAGVVVNDNLVLVDYILRQQNKGMTPVQAIVESGVNRFRPILLTTLTTFIGLLPIMAEQSTSAEFLKPAVLSLAFGVFFALFVSLLMVPAMYLMGLDLRAWWDRLWGRTSAVSESHASSV